MGDKSPKAKARAKKQQEMRSKNDKKVAAEPRSPRPPEAEAAPKTP
ncbi:MAG: hypothetical protein KF850_00165 [Labilithrix sp.]|nr:hypothetical protein [Labilithrix sp.]MBX3210424.1 hypothetical protein [Labilithrix sp.]